MRTRHPVLGGVGSKGKADLTAKDSVASGWERLGYFVEQEGREHGLWNRSPRLKSN